MKEVVRNRTIRPSTRLDTSKSYKIDTKNVYMSDTLIVNIDHETKPFLKSYKFRGSDVAHRDSISFRVNEIGSSITITWSGATPVGNSENKTNTEAPKTFKAKPVDKIISKPSSINIKTSFDPISDTNTTVLILGTMPGDKSLELGEYYGHARNRFWKIISTITENNLPLTYSDKKKLLLTSKIGIWDVAHSAKRKGSLDSAIQEEVPNDIDTFISRHSKLKIIAFNGSKSEKLFDKYFNRNSRIRYISLPSSSPANTGIDFEAICNKWKQILKS